MAEPIFLAARWPLPELPEVRDELLVAYGAPGRGYHDLLHLGEVLDRLDELASAGTSYDVLPVTLAAWFHDAVYDGRPDVEARSADLALERLRDSGLGDDAIDEVARLVRLTEHHRPDPGDVNGSALSDADLAILAAPAERYDAYVAGVRREYDALTDEEFRTGRSRILRELAAKPSLFETTHGRTFWEPAARVNLDRELRARG